MNRPENGWVCGFVGRADMGRIAIGIKVRSTSVLVLTNRLQRHLPRVCRHPRSSTDKHDMRTATRLCESAPRRMRTDPVEAERCCSKATRKLRSILLKTEIPSPAETRVARTFCYDGFASIASTCPLAQLPACHQPRGVRSHRRHRVYSVLYGHSTWYRTG